MRRRRQRDPRGHERPPTSALRGRAGSSRVPGVARARGRREAKGRRSQDAVGPVQPGQTQAIELIRNVRLARLPDGASTQEWIDRTRCRTSRTTWSTRRKRGAVHDANEQSIGLDRRLHRTGYPLRDRSDCALDHAHASTMDRDPLKRPDLYAFAVAGDARFVGEVLLVGHA